MEWKRGAWSYDLITGLLSALRADRTALLTVLPATRIKKNLGSKKVFAWQRHNQLVGYPCDYAGSTEHTFAEVTVNH